MSTAFLYPGQGSQRVGMLGALPDSAATRQTLSEATDVLGDISALDSAEALIAGVAAGQRKRGPNPKTKKQTFVEGAHSDASERLSGARSAFRPSRDRYRGTCRWSSPSTRRGRTRTGDRRSGSENRGRSCSTSTG